MNVSKVIYGGETLIDLTNDTVTEDTLAEGVTAHNASGDKITGTLSLAPCLEMPQIRFTSLQGESPLKFIVEIVGGGALREGDALQVCAVRTFGKSAQGTKPKKKKLRRFAEYTVTADDLDKQYLTVSVAIDQSTSPYLFCSNRSDANSLSAVYLRIRRPHGDLQNNDSGMTVDAKFSNVVTVWKTYSIENLTVSLV